MSLNNKLIQVSPSDILEINSYVFGGKWDVTKPFRVLIISGNGDAIIYLSKKLNELKCPAEIVCIQINDSTKAIVTEFLNANNLKNTVFIENNSDIGVFDYIDASGCGLDQFQEKYLKQGGGVSFVIPGKQGYRGISDLKRILELIKLPENSETIRDFILSLPASNWAVSNPCYKLDNLNDEEIYEKCFVIRKAYFVNEIIQIIKSYGLNITAFIDPIRYDPLTYVNDINVNDLTIENKWELAELMAGNFSKHVFYAVKGEIPLSKTNDYLTTIPVLDSEFYKNKSAIVQGGFIEYEVPGLTLNLKLPSLASKIIQEINGERTIHDVYKRVNEVIEYDIDLNTFLVEFEELYKILNGINQMFLSSYPYCV